MPQNPSNNIKLCVVTTVAFTIRVFLLDQLAFLSRNGFDVTIVCDYDSDLAKNCPPGIKYQHLAMDRKASVFSTLAGLIGMYRLLKQEKFDMVQYCTPKAALISSISGWVAGIPVRLYCQWGIRYVGMEGLKRLLFKLIEKVTCSFSTHVSPDSFGNLEFAIAEGLYQREKASVVFHGSANGVNLARFNPEDKGSSWRMKIRQQLGIAAADFVFGWIGRVTRDKGVNELIAAFLEIQKDDSSRLLMVGPMEGQGLLPEVLQAISSHPNIHYVGLQHQVEEYYAAMDVLVVPSYREGFGSFALEAQAMGIPVISTDIPGPKEAIIDGKTGILVPVQDKVALINAMLELKNNHHKRNTMARAGRTFVKERFDQVVFWKNVLTHRLGLLTATKNIRVLQICAVGFTVSNIMLPLIDRLLQEGYEVHTICSDGPEIMDLRKRGYTIKVVKISRKISAFSHFMAFWKMFFYIKSHKFDVVHVHTPIAAFIGRVAAKVAGVPVIIYTAHGFYFHDLMKQYKRKALIFVEKIAGRWFTDLIITVSTEDWQTAIKEGIALPEAVVAINNGVNVSRFMPDTEKADAKRKELHIGKDELIIGFVGRLVKEKGILDLLHAFEQVIKIRPETRLLMIGDDRADERDMHAKDESSKLIEKYGIGDKIIFTGYRKDISDLIALMNVFVLPSYREGLPISILEAMAMAKPVVATNIRGCREEVINNVTGLLVPVKAPQELAAAIIKILSDTELARRMGMAARQRVEAIFNEQDVLDKQLLVIRSQLNKNCLERNKRCST